MNMMTPEKLLDANEYAAATENPTLKRMMKQWEKKLSKNAKRAGGFGMIAFTLAACGGSSSTDSDSTDPDPGTTPVPAGGVWSLVAGGLQLAGDFDPAIFAGGAIPAGVLTGNPATLTPGGKNQWVEGDGLPSDGDDLVLTSSDSFMGATINLGAGEDTVFVNVTGDTVSGLVTNVEIIELSNIATNSVPGVPGIDPIDGGLLTPGIPGVPAIPAVNAVSIVNLSNVVNIEKVTISEASVATDDLQVVGIRNTATIEMQGNFNNDVFIDFLNATGPLNLILNDYFQNSGELNIAQDFTTVNMTSAGEGTLNAIDSGALGDNLQTLNITGAVNLEITGGLEFRPNTQAKIDAGGFEGENLTVVVDGHRDVMFTGSDANDSLSVETANAAVGPDQVIKLTVDFGAGENTLVINGDGFVLPTSSIVSEGDLTLIIDGEIDMSQPDAQGNVLDLSAVTKVIIDENASLDLTAAQVAQIGIENFETPDFGNETGELNIVGVDGEPLDLSNIDVGTVVNIITIPGDVALSEETVLGNQNAGVSAVIVDNRGTDSTVTMSAMQFQQLDGTGKVTSWSEEISTAGTNNPFTGQPYTSGLILTDLDPDTEYNLGDVNTTTTDIQLTGFTAGSDFAITNAGGTELTVTLVDEVDLTAVAAGNLTVDNLVFTDGAVLTTEGQPIVNGDFVFEGAATINALGNNTVFSLDTDNIIGDPSQVVVNFEGTGGAILDISGSNDITLKAVNAGDDITFLTIHNTLDAGATLDVTGGSPAMLLGEDAVTLTVNGDVGTTTLIGTDPDHPGISSATLATINASANVDAVINLGVLSVTSSALTVNGSGPGLVTVEISEVPAGAAWVFNGVELVINDVADFDAGATIKLGPNTTLAGDATISDILPFLTSDSIVPLDATSTAAEIDAVLQALQANQATINVTGMNQGQLEAIIDNSLKVGTINGDLELTSNLSAFKINTLSNLYTQGADDVLTINADGMTTAQKAASANAVAANTTVVNLTLDSNDSVATIGQLLPDTANNSTVVEAEDMSAGQLNALVPHMPKVHVINDMTLTDGNSPTQITALLSKAASESVTVDAEDMVNAQFAAIVEQITKIEVVENLTVTAGSPAQRFQFEELLELAVDAQVNAAGMSNGRLSIVAENIDNIADDGIFNLTITAAQTADEITALMGKAPDDSVTVNLSDMDADQVAAVSGAADKVDTLSVSQNSSVTLTLAEFNALNEATGAALIGEGADGEADTGGSITIVADADGTLDLAQVAAGASGPGTSGTLTLQIDDGVSLSIEGVTLSETLEVTGEGTLVVTGPVPLVSAGEPFAAKDVSIEGGITLDLAPDSQLWLTAQQMAEFTADGGTVTKQEPEAGETEGFIRAFAGDSDDAEPQDLSALDLSLIDVLVLEDNDRTILPSLAAALPAQVGEAFSPHVLVPEDTDWSAYEGFFQADIDVAPDATVTVSAASASQMTSAASFIIGEAATEDGQTGGSIIVTALENGEEYDLSGNFVPGGDGGFAADAGTYVVSISSDVTLEPGTILPTAAQIVIDAGAALTVNAGVANQADNNYEGVGTLNFVDLDGNTVQATDDVRFNTFTFDADDTAVIINGFEAIGVAGLNGRFSFEEGTGGDPDILGTMSLDLSAFETNGTGFVPVADIAALNGLASVANAGVIVIRDGASPSGEDLSGITGAQGAELFFAFENGANVEVQYWDDANDDGVIDAGELELVATLTDTDTTQLGSENFTI